MAIYGYKKKYMVIYGYTRFCIYIMYCRFTGNQWPVEIVDLPIQVNVEGRTDNARIYVPGWNAVVTAKSEKVGPGL